jgi:hypothetical protein
VSLYHDQIAHAVAPLCGREITQAEILNAYTTRSRSATMTYNGSWARVTIQITASVNAQRPPSLFEHVDRGKYRLLW